MFKSNTKNQVATGWIIWFIGALFYCYNIGVRVYPSTMSDYLMNFFNLNGAQFGFLTSSFYYSYVGLLIPVGILVDRFDVRKVLVLACGAVLLGQYAFLESHTLSSGSMSRFLIGAGCAFAYISALKLASIWLPKNRFGLAVCCTDSLGMVSAMLIDSGLPRFSQIHSYRFSIWMIFFIGIAVLLLIMLLIRDRKRTIQIYHIGFNQGPLPHQRDTLKTLTMILRNKQIWIIGIVGCFSYVPSSVFGDVWGISYLKNAYNMSTQSASYIVSIMFLGWICAGPIIGLISDHFRSRKVPLYISYTLCMILFAVILAAPMISTSPQPISKAILYVIFFIIGVCIGTHPLCFVLAKENFATKIAGTVVGISNVLIMMGGVVFQPMVGMILDRTSGSNLSHIHGAAYSVASYTKALAILPLSFIVCIALVSFIKETGHTLDKFNA